MIYHPCVRCCSLRMHQIKAIVAQHYACRAFPCGTWCLYTAFKNSEKHLALGNSFHYKKNPYHNILKAQVSNNHVLLQHLHYNRVSPKHKHFTNGVWPLETLTSKACTLKPQPRFPRNRFNNKDILFLVFNLNKATPK